MPLGLAADVSGVRATPKYCAPPSWFRGVEGVRSAWPDSGGPFGRTPARLAGSAAQKAGKRYERKAIAYLQERLGKAFLPSPWYKFHDRKGTLRWCQPDGLVLLPGIALLFEIKIGFTSDAWWQTRKLYEPVLRVAHGVGRVAPFVICKSFDSAVPYPEAYLTLPEILPCPPSGWDCTLTGVVQWKP